jgi:hypothetical protein
MSVKTEQATGRKGDSHRGECSGAARPSRPGAVSGLGYREELQREKRFAGHDQFLIHTARLDGALQ